jgi:cytochrome c biogenesis protein CcmG, thiol:disulfide interchange protein DsbE
MLYTVAVKKFALSAVILLVLAVSAAVATDESKAAAGFCLPGLAEDICLDSLKGRVVYLDFWASWCKPCADSFPWMINLQHEFADAGLIVLAINLDKKKKKALKFLEGVDPILKIAFDPKGITPDLYQVQAMPSSYLLDRNGRLRYSHKGFSTESAGLLRSKVKELLLERRVKELQLEGRKTDVH